MFFLNIPKNVKINLGKNWIQIKGPLGVVLKKKSANIKLFFNEKENKLYLLNHKDNKNKHFLFSLINNLVWGVYKGYQVTLNIIGVGYKADVKDDKLILKLGYSHEVIFTIPKDISIKVLNKKLPTLVVSGTNLQKVNQIAADVRKLKLPEPYKGKGIRYSNEIVKQKEGKKTNV